MMEAKKRVGVESCWQVLLAVAPPVRDDG